MRIIIYILIIFHQRFNIDYKRKVILLFNPIKHTFKGFNILYSAKCLVIKEQDQFFKLQNHVFNFKNKKVKVLLFF